MKKNQTYAVFGLGRYGMAVARELVANGKEVIAIDGNQKLVNEASDFIPVCKCADVTNADVFARLDIGSVDTAIICMASSLEASVMAVTLCKEVGVKNVIAKCSDEMQEKILLRVGADKVVCPESESGVRLAQNLLSSGFIDMISLSKDASIVEIDVKKEWLGKNFIELNLRKKYGINVVAIKKMDKIDINITPEQVLDENTKLIVIASNAKLSKLS